MVSSKDYRTVKERLENKGNHNMSLIFTNETNSKTLGNVFENKPNLFLTELKKLP